ncbi:MAG TPA: phytanoyl-CoA dioxygenase family protein [Gemmataceae bacterium]|nr:phytanoyl-CoA dioxygenase family protein [Gemmataceae bacterium]
MGKQLSASHLRCYAEEGLVFPLRVLSFDETLRYRTACDDLEKLLGGKPRTIEVRQMHLHFPWAFELASHPGVLDAVEDVIGPDVLLWSTELFAKHPHDPFVSINWHRDRPYMGFSGGQSTTAWISLADSMPANGCMRAVPMSREHGDKIEPETDAVNVVLQAGEMSLHTQDILHGSGTNNSEEKRIGFAVRYVTPAARPAHGKPPVVLVRGRDAFRHFGEGQAPAADPTRAALAAFKESAIHHLDVILRNLRHAEDSKREPVAS